MPRRPRLGALALASLVACAEDPDRVQIVDGTVDDWHLVEHPRGSLDDLDGVSGPTLTFRVGSSVSTAGGVIPRDGGLDADLVLPGGEAPRAAWEPVNGTAVALDFDTLAMFSAYVLIERSLGYFERLGAREEVFANLDVHYAADGMGEGNAAYHMAADAMLVLRPADDEELPLSMNVGVLTHELGHRMTYWELWDGQALATLTTIVDVESQLAAYLILRGADEGMADYFGAVHTGDPRYVVHSITDADRDLSVPKVGDPTMWTFPDDIIVAVSTTDPHILGAVLASALWAVGEEIGHDVVATGVLDVQRELSPQALALDYEMGDLEVALVARLGPEACPAFLHAYAAIADRFDEVCP